MGDPETSRTEARLLSILLTSCGAAPADIARVLSRGPITSFASGDSRITILRLGALGFPFTSDPHQTLLAEMRFGLSGMAIQWLLLRYPNGECEIEVLVNGGSMPWNPPVDLPAKIEILFGKEVK